MSRVPMTSEVRDVALLALIYREQYLARRTGLDSVGRDLETCPGEVSWLTMIGVDRLTPYDWALLRELNEPSDFLALARRTDPLRAEALLHAVPPNGCCSKRPWAQSFRARWGHVQARMRQFEHEGYSATRDDLESVAAWAWQTVTGGSIEEYAEAWS